MMTPSIMHLSPDRSQARTNQNARILEVIIKTKQMVSGAAIKRTSLVIARQQFYIKVIRAHLLKINEAIIVRVPFVEISCKIVFVIKGCISVLNEINNIELRTELLQFERKNLFHKTKIEDNSPFVAPTVNPLKIYS